MIVKEKYLRVKQYMLIPIYKHEFLYEYKQIGITNYESKIVSEDILNHNPQIQNLIKCNLLSIVELNVEQKEIIIEDEVNKLNPQDRVTVETVNNKRSKKGIKNPQ